MKQTHRFVNVLAVLAIVLTLGGVAAGQSTTVYYACVNKDGTIVMKSGPSQCGRNQQGNSWTSRGLRDHRVRKDPLVLRVRKGHKATQDPLVLRVRKGHKATEDPCLWVRKVHKAIQDPLVLRVRKGHKATQDLLVLRVRKGLRDQRDRKDPLVLRVHKATQDPTADVTALQAQVDALQKAVEALQGLYKKTVFVSSVSYKGNLGGLDRADAKCQALATNAGLPGIFKAWLSDSDRQPLYAFTHSPGPYVLVNGTKIADYWADLTDGALAAKIDCNENGGPDGGPVWTATSTTGELNMQQSPYIQVLPPYTCQEWTSDYFDPSDQTGIWGSIGLSYYMDENWTASDSQATCNSEGVHLYCFQQ